MAEALSTDYLIVGAGAMGMAFADTLLSDSDADMIIVDRHARPGGHWNIAYPYVTLHQPSSFYGVASRELSRGRIDETGLNKGLADLATLPEIQGYYDAVMRDTLLPSGCVRYFPNSRYEGAEGGVARITNQLSGAVTEIAYGTFVDATFLQNSVPANHTPNFTVAEGVSFMPLGELPKVLSEREKPPAGFVVIGGGKTGIDALLWLLEQGADPDRLTWIVSRDGWMFDRATTQTRPEFFKQTIGTQAAAFEAMAQSQDRDEMFLKLEEAGYFVRIDPDVLPQMFHAPTISRDELAALRTVGNIVRLGRVKTIDRSAIVLERGTIPTTPGHIHIDCSATAISNKMIKPVFRDDTITLQTVRAFQPSFSASLIAHVAASDRTEAQKNAVTGVVPLPDTLDDFVRMQAANMMNQAIWSQDKNLQRWIRGNRLDGFSDLIASADKSDPEVVDILTRLRANAMPAAMKLQSFLN